MSGETSQQEWNWPLVTSRSVYQSAASAYYCTWFMVQMGGSDQYCNASRVTAKPAIRGHFKSGHGKVPGT